MKSKVTLETGTVLELVAREAVAARRALSALTDTRCEQALARTAEMIVAQAPQIRAANDLDLDEAADLDEGARDRLKLDNARLATIAAGLRATAALPPIERTVRTWRLANGLDVTERRIPIGVLGANFEARPGVALDIAAQVLRSGNAVVLRTGSAALR